MVNEHPYGERGSAILFIGFAIILAWVGCLAIVLSAMCGEHRRKSHIIGGMFGVVVSAVCLEAVLNSLPSQRPDDAGITASISQDRDYPSVPITLPKNRP